MGEDLKQELMAMLNANTPGEKPTESDVAILYSSLESLADAIFLMIKTQEDAQ